MSNFLSSLLQKVDRPAGHVGGLDALRFASVYCILLSHSGFEAFGGFGVPILMALSGYLITRQLLAEVGRAGAINVKRFWIGRLLRIAPAYFVFVGVTFLADFLTGNDWPPGLIWYALTYTVNYYNAIHGHPSLSISHVWTLAILEQFYLIWPLLFSVFASSSRRIVIMLFIALCGLIWRSVAYKIVFVGDPSWVYNAVDCRIDSVMVGCIAAVLVESRRVYVAGGHAASFAAIFLALAFVAFSNDYKPWHYTFGYLFEACAAMVLILYVSRLSSLGGFRWIDSVGFSWLGKISYGVFLYHILSIGVAKKIVEDQYAQVFLATVIVLFAASFSYYFVESPVMRYRDKLRQGWRLKG